LYNAKIKRRKANIVRRNRLPKYVIKGNVEGSTEVMGRQGRRRKKLLDDLQEKNKTMLEIER